MPTIEDENTSTSAAGKGRNSRRADAGASRSTASQNKLNPEGQQLIQEAPTRENMSKAMKRVEQNQATAGVDELNPVIRGWGHYFSLTRVKKIPEELDFWIRRKLRCILRRQIKRVQTRAKRMINRGLKESRAWAGATNGRGPWCNAGASHINQAYPITYFNKLGSVALQTKLMNF